MSFLANLASALFKLLCGSNEQQGQQQQQPQQHQQQHQQPHRPSHQQQQHSQHQYPPTHAPSPHQAPHKPAHQQQSHPSPPSSPPHHTPSPGRKYEDDNQRNQQNEHYKGLRAQANAEGDAMARCFQESREVYSRGDGGRAKELSNEGKEHQRKMEEFNRKASEWIFVENNRDSAPGEIDLHGLYVKEAIAHTDAAIEEAKRRGDSEVRLIVGKGIHSSGGHAKIKPAIEELMDKHSLSASVDPHNAGVLVVAMGGGRDRGGFGADDISRKLERGGGEDEGCVVM